MKDSSQPSIEWSGKRLRMHFLLASIMATLLLSSPIVVQANALEGARELAHKLREQGISPLFIAGLVSMIPVFELRGGIPVGIALFKLNPLAVYSICTFFNIIPVLPILLLLNPARRVLERIPLLRRMFDFFTGRALKNRELIERYEELGLTLFVGIPLPVTGAWTGSLIAVILNLGVMKSFFFITLGVLLAGIIVTLISLLGTYGIIGAAAILALYAVLYLRKVIQKKRKMMHRT